MTKDGLLDRFAIDQVYGMHNGPGIPVYERERVFERFYRTLGTAVDGSGLGLAIVREIASIHGATVSIESGQGGLGTTVIVQFPLSFAPGGAHLIPCAFRDHLTFELSE